MTVTPVDVVIAAGTLLTAALLIISVVERWRTKRQAIRDTAAEAERRLEDRLMPDPPSIHGYSMSGPWTGTPQPCSHEDNWCSGECKPPGRHSAQRHTGQRAARGVDYTIPLDDMPASVIVAAATDLQRRQR